MTQIDSHVPAHEHGVLRLYTLDTGHHAGRTLRDALESGGPAADRAAAAALGVPRVEAQWLGLVDLRDLGDMDLETYLARGYDVPADQLAAARDPLAGAEGSLLVVPSRAFAAEAAEIAITPALSPLTQFTVDDDPGPVEPMDPATTEPVEAEPMPPRNTGRRLGLGSLGPVQILAIVIAVAVLIGLIAQF